MPPDLDAPVANQPASTGSSIRDAIGAAMDADPMGSTSTTEQPASGEGSAPSYLDSAETPPAKDPPPEQGEGAEPPPAQEEPPPAEQQAKPPAQKGKGRQKPEEGLKAPETWKPAIRDKHWKTLPPAVQSEIHRREAQVNEALKVSATARKGMEQVNELITSYRDVFEREKMPPLQTMSNLLNISRNLRNSPPAQRAQLMAQVIQGFDVDVTLLDKALAYHYENAPQRQEQNTQMQAIQQAVAQQMAPVNQYFNSLRQGQAVSQRVQEQGLQTEVQKFLDNPENEYAEVVRDTMADLLEAAANRGQKLSIQDAYKRAVLADERLAPVYMRKQAEGTAKQLSAAGNAAQRRASFSISGAPSSSAPREGGFKDVRGALEAAIDQHSGRMQ